MIHALRHIKINLLLATLAAGLLCGCSDSCDEPIPDVNGDSEGAITVVLRVPTDSPGSRENPMPGEDGNGREQGILNENTIYDVNIFFFVGDGLNADASVSVSGVYISDMSSADVTAEELPFEKKYTIKMPSGTLDSSVLSAATTVSFATVVNAGRDLSKQFSTLADLRSFNGFDAAWQNTAASINASDCDRFVMTTAYDADVDGLVLIDGKNRSVGSNRLVKRAADESDQSDSSDLSDSSDKSEWKGETTIQRICARIDLMYTSANIAGASENSINHLVYSVPETGSKVHITNALPVNAMQKPSYFLTRVTQSIPTSWAESSLGNITWGGVENSAGSPAAPSNYVIDPRTLLKESSVSDATLAEWYGDTRAANVVNKIKDLRAGEMSKYYSGELPIPEPGFGCTHNTILGYANENVQSPNQFHSAFLTGIIFRATYQPGKWHSYENGVLTEYKLSDKSDSSAPSDDAAWALMSDKSFTRYMPTANGKDVVNDTKALYFADDAQARQYAAAHPEDFATLTRFDKGICYYNLWLRHYNDESADPQATYPMEYAIVRNNIYRVALTFSGTGEPQPELREPDTMKARIFVRKWNLRQETNPLEF